MTADITRRIARLGPGNCQPAVGKRAGSTVMLVVAAMMLLTGCDRHQAGLPLAPTPSVASGGAAAPEVRPDSVPNWTATALVVGTSGYGGCGWGRTPGETRAAMWRIVVDGPSILLDEDMANWPTDDIPYRGTLDGLQFTADVTMPPDYLKYTCQWRGGTLTGRFNADFTTFEADESVVWGPPEAETVVRRHWSGTRR